jgi:RNA polymerase primary sigma factor
MATRDPNDPVALYLREAAIAEPLSATEETEIFRRLGTTDGWHGDTEDAARRVIESYLRLVVPIAERHAASSGVSVLDLIQEGNIALWNAVETFAKNPSGVFSEYASVCIGNAISKAVAESK